MSKNSVIEAKAENKKLSPFAASSNSRAAASKEGDVPTRVDSYIKGGFLFLIFTLGIFTAWAALAPLSSAIIAHGEVVVENYRRTIQHLEGGIIERIYVRDGDRVEAGQPLLQLQTTQWDAEQEMTRKRLLTTQAEWERLQIEQEIIESLDDFNLPANLGQRELNLSAALLEEARLDEEVMQVVRQQRQLFRARLAAFAQQQQSLVSRIEQIQQQVLGLEEQQAILQEQIQATEEEQRAFATLFDEGLADGQRARDLRRTLLDLRNRAAGHRSEIARMNLQAIETQLQITANRQNYLKEVGERHRDVQSNYFDLQERMRVTSDALRRATLTAPDAGTVVDLQVHTLGSIARPGTTLLELVPDNEAFVVEARIETVDVNHLFIGQLADIRFSAFNQRLTKVIEAEVVNISADRLLDERSGMAYYLVRLRVTDQGRADMNRDMDLKPGMPAEVMIRRGERTMFSYLFKPLSDAFARALTEK
ncbi:HlyD family type I secretion periplasmic adaptor subunit [Marinospirillum sp. MEB164]|uniref:Membrane fusion protein (MFP) family protein n=1 Tax=Marinospirillum alkalitolerans TaxID=3123374 RepID=A0ABW8PV04_9GAMM